MATCCSVTIPQEIVELEAIKTLIDAGVVTISVGAAVSRVIRNDKGELEGVAAVIDKDFGSSLLARNIKATCFDFHAVEKVAINLEHRMKKVIK
jgi:carbamate kinase